MNRRRRRSRRVRIADPKRFAISIAIMAIALILLVSGVKALVSSGSKNTDPTSTNQNQVKDGKTKNGKLTLDKSQMEADLTDLVDSLDKYYPLKDYLEENGYNFQNSEDQARTSISSIQSDQDFYYLMEEFAQKFPGVSILSTQDFAQAREDYSKYTDVFQNGRVLDYYGPGQEAGNQTAETTEAIEAQETKETEQKTPTIIDNSTSLGLSTAISGGNLSFDKSQDEYALINFSSFEEKNIPGDMKKINDFLVDISDHETLVLDIRGINNGSSKYWLKLAETLSSEDLYYTARIVQKGEDFIKNVEDASNLAPEIEISDMYPIDELPEDMDFPGYLTDKFNNFWRINYTVYGLKDGGSEEDQTLVDEENPEEETEMKPVAKKGNVFDGHIVLLQDESVSGAGDGFSALCKYTGLATVLGTKTSGGGISSEFPPAFVSLPNSGLVMKFPSVLGIDYYGYEDASGTTPDIEFSNIDLNPENLKNFFSEE